LRSGRFAPTVSSTGGPAASLALSFCMDKRLREAKPSCQLVGRSRTSQRLRLGHRSQFGASDLHHRTRPADARALTVIGGWTSQPGGSPTAIPHDKPAVLREGRTCVTVSPSWPCW
jgi:hypothetical protein